MSLFKITSLKVRHPHEPPKGVNSCIVAEDFNLTFPEKYIVITDDPVFLRLISEDWSACLLMAYLPKTFNNILKRVVMNDKVKGLYFKAQLFGYDELNPNKILDNKVATQKIQQLIAQHPILGMLFEDYTLNSGFFQFKIGLQDNQLKKILSIVDINQAVKDSIHRLWSSNTITAKDAYVFTKKLIDARGRVTSPFSRSKTIFVSSKLAKGTEVIMMFSFDKNTLTFYLNNISKPIKVLRIVKQKTGIALETVENDAHETFVKLFRLYSNPSVPKSIRVETLKTGINISLHTATTTFKECYLSISSAERFRLPEKWHHILEGVEAKCTLAFAKKIAVTGFETFNCMLVDFEYHNKKEQLLYMNNKGSNQLISENNLLQLPILIKDITDNMVCLPHLKSNILVDNKGWDKIIVIIDKNNSIVGINKVYASNEAPIPVKIKRILPLLKSETNTILVSHFPNFSERIREKINGVIEMVPHYNNKSFVFKIGETNNEQHFPISTSFRYSNLNNNLYQLIKSGLLLNPEHLGLSFKALNFDLKYISLLQKASVNINEFVSWLNINKYASISIGIDFDTLSVEQSPLIIETMTNYFKHHSNGSVKPEILASKLLNELRELFFKFNPTLLKSYAIMENGFPLGYIFKYKEKIFNPYELITIRSKNNAIILSSKVIRNMEIIKHPELYKYELNRIICIDKLANFHDKGYKEKNRFTLENRIFVHLIKSGNLPMDTGYKAISLQILQNQ